MSTSWVIKSQPTPGDVHVNRPLTDMSVAFLQAREGFAASRVFPLIQVAKQSDSYFTLPRGYWNRDLMRRRAPATEAQMAGLLVSTDNYLAQVYALGHPIPDQVRANSDEPLQPERMAIEFLSTQALIRQEVNWGTAFFTTGVWTSGVTVSPKWDTATGVPLTNIQTGIQTVLGLTGKKPNVAVFGYPAWSTFLNNAQVIDRLKAGQANVGQPARVVNEAQVAAMLGLDEVIVSMGIQNTAREGAADAHSFILGDGVLLLYVAPSPGIMTASAGYTFSWTGYLGAGPMGQNVRLYRDEKIRSDIAEMEIAFDQKLVSADLGYFLNDVTT